MDRGIGDFKKALELDTDWPLILSNLRAALGKGENSKGGRVKK